MCHNGTLAYDSMNWLHFCDFHIGGARAPQANALHSLVKMVEKLCAETGKTVDAVFLAGDLAFSGKAKEYDRFRDDFLLPLRNLKAVSGATFFAVPGNHDVDCDVGLPVRWENLASKKQDIFFAEDQDGIALRKQRADVFEAYRSFVVNNMIYSPDPSAEVSKIYDFPNLPIAILATNTAFFSDEKEHERPQSTPIPLTSLRSYTARDNRKKPILILGHHSPNSFRKDHLRNFRQLLLESSSPYLHGHEHDAEAVYNHDGALSTLGFGATYLQSLDVNADQNYTNTFTFCSLEDRLLLTAFSWEHGMWRDTTTIQFKAECINKEPYERVAIFMPGRSRLAYQSTPSSKVIALVARSHPIVQSVVAVEAPNKQVWLHLLGISNNVRRITQQGSFTVTQLPDTDERWESVLEVDGKSHLLVCIPGNSHILSAKEVESLNTTLDTKGYASVTVISFGKFSDEAQAMYLQLVARKGIEILVNSDLAADADRVLSVAQKQHIQELDAATTEIRLLATEENVYLLGLNRRETERSFYLLSELGELVAPGDPLVIALRKGNEDLQRIPYRGENFQSPLEMLPDFNEEQYLQKVYTDCNSTKYAALANIGFRFSDMPLKELYVNATATELPESRTARLEAMVDDHLAQFPVSEAIKSHAKRELLSVFDEDARRETSDAREYCQKYSSALVVGDPGSGKTCFVKREILEYCERARGEIAPAALSTWHSTHVPVLLALSEMVAEIDFESVGLFVIIERVQQRKGLIISDAKLNELALRGRLALFFDGLDEVVSVERRAQVVAVINRFIKQFSSFGNRVVVTSRPAAIQLVNLLPEFHKLELQGLADADMRVLAKRVLSFKLADSSEGPILDQGTETERDTNLVDRLLADCATNPGLNRLAQNPLLLTLLILIYANSGALSAKRHLIYEEAIRTLSSLRGREAGHIPISAQDLRERLGAVALAVYRRQSGLLPTRLEVKTIVKNVMQAQYGEEVSLEKADDFLQRVAESTGLISIGAKGDDASDSAVVVFMHHSFLEYFAAIGLSLNVKALDIQELVREPRWREIFTLFAGIIGETSDITPILQSLLDQPETTDADAKTLLFALDCALETEIPSESAQRLLSKAIVASVTTGPARIDPWVQSEIGRRLAWLIESCGEGIFSGILEQLIRSTKVAESGAAIKIVGYAFASLSVPENLRQAMTFAAERDEDIVVSALCWLGAQNPAFRWKEIIEIITRNLTKSRRRKRYAFEALANMPELASEQWSTIINGMTDDDPSVKKYASIAAVQAGLNTDLLLLDGSRKDIIVRGLRLYENSSVDDPKRKLLRHETIERLLNSRDRRDRLIGIGLLPKSDFPEDEAINSLLQLIEDSHDREEVVAALHALRYSGSSLVLVRGPGLQTIETAFEEGNADVREASLQVLAYFGSDVRIVKYLTELPSGKMGEDEFRVFMAALGNARVSKPEVILKIEEELDNCSGPSIRQTEDNILRSAACLDALTRLEENGSERLTNRLDRLVDDFRVDERVRSRSLSAWVSSAMPSARLVEKLTTRLMRSQPEWEEKLVQTPSLIARKCRQSVDYVIACVSSLGLLKEAAVSLHKRVSSRDATLENQWKTSELREGIEDVNNIVVTFNEFINKPVIRDL